MGSNAISTNRPRLARVIICAPVALLCTLAPGCSGDRVGWPTFAEVSGTNRVSSTFGPREQGRGNSVRYDFHRGLDMPSPYGWPARAMIGGTVRIAGDDSDYGEDTVQLVHCLDAEPPRDLLEQRDECESLYYSHYSHLSEILVQTGDRVIRGQKVGLTGEGASGLEHLHIEFRAGNVHKADAVHPLSILPYDNLGLTTVAIDEVDASNPAAIEVAVTVTAPPEELDIDRIEVEVFDSDTGAASSSQSYAFTDWNRMYPDDDLDEPSFNGVLVEPEEYTRTSAEYVVHVRFLELSCAAPEANCGIVARTVDVQGEVAQVTRESL